MVEAASILSRRMPDWGNCSHLNNVGGPSWRHAEPRLRLLFSGQALVMGVNHRGGVSSLLSGQVLIAVSGEMIRAESMAKSAGLASDCDLLALDLHPCLCAQLNEML